MKKLLTLKDVLAICHVEYGTLYRWRKNGTFPDSVGVGKLLWREDQLIEWMNRQSTSTVNVTSATQRKRKEKAFDQRQEAAAKVLQKHADNR